jgi:REP element-mobilizing transposase RayT
MNEKKEHTAFYPDDTPPETGNYPVTASLKYYFKTHIENTFRTENLDEKLTSLFSETEKENPFNEKETHFLVEKINQLKIIDLTVTDGSFLIEVLNKLTFLLSKLDPHNEKWKQQQIMALDSIADPTLKSALREKIETIFSPNAPDYARKRYVFQNCLYGMCIDPSSLNAAKHNLLNCLFEEQEAVRDMNTRADVDSLFHLETNPLAANTPIGSSKHREEERCHTNRSDDEFDPEHMFGIETKSVTIHKNRKLFHITWRTYNSPYRKEDVSVPSKEQKPVLFTLDERNRMADILAERIRMKKYRVLALNVLQDHVHLLLAAKEEEVTKIIDDLKGYSSYTFNRIQEKTTANDATGELTPASRKNIRKRWSRKYNTDLVADSSQVEKVIKEIQHNHLKHGLPPIDFEAISPALTPYKQAFEPETISTGFDIVFGNLHCVNTKKIPENKKNPSMQSCEFADELYARLIFKGFDLLKSDGILALLIPKSSWENLAESTVSELLRKNNILEIFDAPSPFAGRVDTVVILAVAGSHQNKRNDIA